MPKYKCPNCGNWEDLQIIAGLLQNEEDEDLDILFHSGDIHCNSCDEEFPSTDCLAADQEPEED